MKASPDKNLASRCASRQVAAAGAERTARRRIAESARLTGTGFAGSAYSDYLFCVGLAELAAVGPAPGRSVPVLDEDGAGAAVR